jgi:hypothetical protein
LLTPLGAAQAQSADLARPPCRVVELDELLGQVPADARLLDVVLAPTKTEWRVGETLSISVTARATGRLTLLMVDPQGEVTELFPNPYFNAGDSNFVAAGSRVTIPSDRSDYAIAVSDKLGEARLVALLRPADRPLPLACAEDTDRGAATSQAGGSERWGVRQLRVQVVR